MDVSKITAVFELVLWLTIFGLSIAYTAGKWRQYWCMHNEKHSFTKKEAKQEAHDIMLVTFISLMVIGGGLLIWLLLSK